MIPPVTSATVSPAPQPTSANATLSGDFDVYLKMLTKQMEYQDPLNPEDAGEIATQLAMFSGLEQQVKTNDTLSRIEAGLSASGLSGPQLLGKEVQISVPLRANDPATTLRWAPVPVEATQTLVISDREGNTVDRISILRGVHEHAWAGALSNGDPLPEGEFTATLELRSPDGTRWTRPVGQSAQVSEIVMIADGSQRLILDDGREIAPGQVQGLFTADQPTG